LSANLVGISICLDDGEAWYLPCGHRTVEGALVSGQLSVKTIVHALQPVLAHPGTIKIGHNLKFEAIISNLTWRFSLLHTTVASNSSAHFLIP